MDRFQAMSTLLAVVRDGSLSAAGRRLGVPLATVSRHIADLEDRMRTQLLVRGSRSVSLTTAGEAYVLAAERILGDLAEAERAATGEYAEVQGQILLTAPVVFGRLHLLPVVVDFLRDHPRVDVRLILADRMLQLQEDHVDLALRIGHLPDSSSIAIRIGQVRQVLCAAPSYLAAHGRPVHLDDLARHDCIPFTALGAVDHWEFVTPSGTRSVPLRARLAVSTAEAALDAAAAGLGITRVLSYQMADAERAGRLVRVLEDWEPAPVPVQLIHLAQTRLPRKLRAFLDFAVPRLKGRITPQSAMTRATSQTETTGNRPDANHG